ncbi:MAG: ORF6N domain-containing protein [Bacteroidia bacterium]|nr:ORF6N domain-containing protein [Bacteroidia bacterium]
MNGQLIKADYHSFIWQYRGHRVMMDFDLAMLYEVETKRLKEQVRRNIIRFPKDFMFELNEEEFESLRSQIATSKRGGTRYVPMAFTEQGVAMLSSVLNSEKAIQVNIEIIRAFARYRGLLKETEDIRQEIKTLDEKINNAFKYLLEKIDALHQSKNEQQTRKRIGYRINGIE